MSALSTATTCTRQEPLDCRYERSLHRDHFELDETDSIFVARDHQRLDPVRFATRLAHPLRNLRLPIQGQVTPGTSSQTFFKPHPSL